jgi:hypothetical protein
MKASRNLADGPVRRGERAKGVAAIEALLRMLFLMRDCFPEDDLETVAVYLTVASASTGWSLRDLALLREIGPGPLPEGFQHPTSARAVAESAALPRETVRRKLRALVSAGRIVEDKAGFRIPSDAIDAGRNLEFCRRLVREIKAAPRRISSFDQLEIEDQGKDR